MMQSNPQINAIALLVRKFGTPIPGGYEVRVTAEEVAGTQINGTFQEVPDTDGKGVRWQYFPNVVIELKPGEWWESAPEDEPETKELPGGALDNGEMVKCTSNHPFLMRSGEYKAAELLVPGDSLMPLYRSMSSLESGASDTPTESTDDRPDKYSG